MNGSEEKGHYLRSAAMIGFAVLVCLTAWSFLRPLVFEWFTSTLIVKPGALKAEVPAWALIIGRERVFYAQTPGTVVTLRAEGQRVPAGSLICEVVDEAALAVARLHGQETQTASPKSDQPVIDPARFGKLVKSPVSGVISFSGDGYESLTVDGIERRSRTDLDKGRNPWQTVDGLAVGIGEPLFKVDDGHELFAYLWIRGDPGDFRIPAEETRVSIQIKGHSDPVEAVVLSANSSNLGTALSLRLHRYDSTLLKWREGDVTLVSATYEGMIVPKRALVERRGMLGVYVLSGGRPVFSAVSVRGQVGDLVAVSGIAAGSKVVVNPWSVVAGRRG